jgi:hypothetical protein
LKGLKMSIAQALESSGQRPTNQCLADFALQADQERRDALNKGDRRLARERDTEVKRLLKLMGDS